jgi:katanin p60 ATPase-containing subunit A1
MDPVLLKAAARGREVQEKREAERRRALLVLVLRHLADHGYIEAADRFSTEANVSLSKHDAADNISLLQILQDFEDTHEQRYGKRPKLVKQLTTEVRVLTVMWRSSTGCAVHSQASRT